MSVSANDSVLAAWQANPSCYGYYYITTTDEDGYHESVLATEPDEDSQWATIRAIRKGYLKATDWYLLDANASKLQDESAFTTWRNDMLNLPQDYATPELALTNWPTKPAWVV